MLDVPLDRDLDDHFALLGEFDRVTNKIHDDLTQTPRIA